MTEALSIEYGRVLFLRAVELIAPEVLQSLWQSPYHVWIDTEEKPNPIPVPALKPVSDSGLEGISPSWVASAFARDLIVNDILPRVRQHLGARQRLTVDALSTPKLEPLDSALRLWAQKYNLTDPWCLQTALHTLAWWRFRKNDLSHWCPAGYDWEQ